MSERRETLLLGCALFVAVVLIVAACAVAVAVLGIAPFGF